MEEVLNLGRERFPYLAILKALGVGYPAFLYPLIFKVMEVCFYNYSGKKKAKKVGSQKDSLIFILSAKEMQFPLTF